MCSPSINLRTLIHERDNPHALYDALRERDCIFYDAQSRSWLVTSYDAVTYILKEPCFSAEPAGGAQSKPRSFLDTAIYKQILFREGEVQQKCRALILRHLRQVADRIASEIQATAQELLAPLHGQDEFDLASEFTYPYSLLVIAYIVGVPTGDLAFLLRLGAWSDTHGDVTSGYFNVDFGDIHKAGEYFRQLLATKSRSPGNDLISAFIASNLFQDEDELIANCLMVFSAGRMTTMKALANGVPLLFNHWPAYRSRIISDPALVKTLTEEVLRRITPTRFVVRYALRDIDLSARFPGAHLIRSGEKVILFLEAANRDPAYFNKPGDGLIEDSPSRHVTFGFGPHYCPGAELARLEVEIALKCLFAVFPDLVLDLETVVLSPNPNLGGYDQCCVHPAPSR